MTDPRSRPRGDSSLYGVYHDEAEGVVAINYFPGYAYVWLVVWVPAWIFLVGVAITLRERVRAGGAGFAPYLRLVTVLCGALFVYWLLRKLRVAALERRFSPKRPSPAPVALGGSPRSGGATELVGVLPGTSGWP